MKNMELNLNEMENVNGGRGGSPTMLPEKKGFFVHQIASGENLTRIAKKFGTTVKAIMDANPTIDNANFIRTGFYIYVPVK